MHPIARPWVAAGLALLASAGAQAEWFGSATLSSDNVERGVSQSERKPSLTALLGARHAASGLYAQLGAATVSREQYVGSDGYKLMPEAGWNTSNDDWHGGLALAAQLFPGAKGPWFGSLPARLQNRAQMLQTSDYKTIEARASLGWKFATLSVARSLTDYLGLAATEVGPLGTKAIESKGTTYVALDLEWPLNQSVTLTAGTGRLSVPNFDGLGYSDWRLGASAKAWGLRWAVEASGSNADGSNWRSRSRGNGGLGIAAGKPASSVKGSATWVF